MNDHKNTTTPMVSVITPSYNCAPYLEETILNIRNQDYPHIEHIIIDGESQDDTIRILQKYRNEIQWISEPDNGMYDAINKGFAMANGDILTYINTDDLYFSINTISNVVDEFKKNNSIDFIYGHCAFIDAQGEILYTYKAPKFYRKYALAFPRAIFQQPTCFWRGSAHEPFDSTLKYVGDAKFFRSLCENYTGKRINKIIAKFRIRPDCISFKNREEMGLEDKQVYKNAIKRPPSMSLVIFDILYRMIYLNFLTNIKRQILKFQGLPYL